jgi:hypothetical protein
MAYNDRWRFSTPMEMRTLRENRKEILRLIHRSAKEIVLTIGYGWDRVAASGVQDTASYRLSLWQSAGEKPYKSQSFERNGGMN